MRQSQGRECVALRQVGRKDRSWCYFRCARIILSGVELMHMIRKGQMRDDRRGLSGGTAILPTGGVTPTGSLTKGETVPPTFTRAPLTRQNPSKEQLYLLVRDG